MTLRDRLKEFIEYKNTTPKEFEKKTNLSNGFVNNAGHSIRETSLSKIKEGYPDFDINWLITGQGNMLKTNSAINNGSKDLGPIEYLTLDSPNQFIDLRDGKILMIIAKVDEPAYAGYLSNYSDKEFIETLPMHSIIVEKRHKGTYRAFEIIGDSMDDGSKESIPDGSIATGREIMQDYWKSKFHTHRYKDYIIVSHTEGIIAKRISAQDVEAGIITCHSLNPNKDEFPDREINLRDVKQIFNIVNVSIAR